MNAIIKYSICFSTIFFLKCGPSDKEKLEKAELAVQSFIDELNVENFNSAAEIYPDMNNISKFKVPKNFKISTSKFTSKDENEIKIIGNFGNSDNIKIVQFVLSDENSDNWQITKSKGLSSYYETNLYNALKICSYFDDIESDVLIHKTCQKFEPKFDKLVEDFKKTLENSITFNPHGSNLKNSYGNIGGDIMLKNNTNITVPAFNYEIYIIFLKKNGTPVHSTKYEYNSSSIKANDLHQIRIFFMDYNAGYHKYTTSVKITDVKFIEELLTKSEYLNCADLLQY